MNKDVTSTSYIPTPSWLQESPENPAILRATIEGPRNLLMPYDDAVDQLPTDSQGHPGRDGWAFRSVPSLRADQRIFEIISAGQNLNQTLVAGVKEILSYFPQLEKLNLTWEELPRDTPLRWA